MYLNISHKGFLFFHIKTINRVLSWLSESVILFTCNQDLIKSQVIGKQKSEIGISNGKYSLYFLLNIQILSHA